MICLLGSRCAKWHQDTETSNRCFYGNSYLLCLFTRDFHKSKKSVQSNINRDNNQQQVQPYIQMPKIVKTSLNHLTAIETYCIS